VAVIQTSDRELTRLRVMVDLADGRLAVPAAPSLMCLGRRQVYRLRLDFVAEGPAVLASRKRCRPSNRKHGATFRGTVLTLVRQYYVDFGPTLAAEKLAERHGLTIGVETLRQWTMTDGRWIDRRRRLPSPHPPRRRCECLGEIGADRQLRARLVRRPWPGLHAAGIHRRCDSRIMLLRFVASEFAFDYFRATRLYPQTYGKPVAF
jgi:hypothetical protein